MGIYKLKPQKKITSAKFYLRKFVLRVWERKYIINVLWNDSKGTCQDMMSLNIKLLKSLRASKNLFQNHDLVSLSLFLPLED